MNKIVWTPERAEAGLGTVLIAKPAKPLTLDQYRAALSTRIDRMVRALLPAEARDLLTETVEEIEGLPVTRDLTTVGDVMVFESGTLHEKAGMSGLDWPKPPAKVTRDLQVTPEMLAETSLQEYLGLLYRESV